MGHQIVQVISVLIPVIAIVAGIAAAMFGMYIDFLKKRELMRNYHAERMAAIEKGVELPPLPDALAHMGRTDWRGRAPAARSRRTGLILFFLGVTITLGLWGGGGGGRSFLWGLILVGLGLAFLISSFFDAREQGAGNRGNSGNAGSPGNPGTPSGQDPWPPSGR